MNGSSAYGASKKYTDEHGGGGGTSNYNELSNRPSINGKTLEGNMTWEDLGLTNKILSIERLGRYIYKATFDSIPEFDSSVNTYRIGGCTSFVKNGCLYRNLDFFYDNTAGFRVITKDFEGMGFIEEMNDGSIDAKNVEQLPYHLNDGKNNSGIMVSSHVLFNDWEYAGAGSKNKDITLLPYYILSNLQKMSDISTVLSNYLSNIKIPEALISAGYLMQFLVSDGITTYAILPPTSSTGSYVLQDISSNPKLTNFRWVSDKTVVRTNLQNRPTGVERWNEIENGATLKDLRFTKCYESPIRLSEFIGESGTTKDSTDAQLTTIYDEAHTEYLNRIRNGKTWQTVHSVIYSKNGMESLFVQENFDKDLIAKAYDTNLFLFEYTDGTSSYEKTIKGV